MAADSNLDRIAVGASVAAGLVWGMALLRAWFHPSESAFDSAANLAGATAVAWAVVLLTRPSRQTNRAYSASFVAVVAASGSFLCGGVVWFLGHRHIGGFDHSVLIDLGWRLASGQHLFRDFPSTLPIGFVLGAGWAFSLFGVSWSSIVGWQALFAMMTFLWSFGLLWRISRRPMFSLMLGFALQCGANLITAYWWYNTATSTVAALFFLSAVGFWRAPRSPGFGASYIGSLLVLATMKPNIAGVLIAGITAVLLSSREHRLRAVIFSATAFLLFLGLLALAGTSLREVCGAYYSISGRGFSVHQFLQDLTSLEKYVALLMAAAVGLPWIFQFALRPAQVRARLLAAAAALAGAYGFVTNGELKFVDFLLPLLALWWLHENEAPPALMSRRWDFWGKYVNAVTAMLIVAGLTAGVLRVRVRSIGSGMFFDYVITSTALASPFFSRVESSAGLVFTEAAIARVLREEKPARVFFGPRLQWAYAAFGRPSPRHEPVWWHPGVAYPVSDEEHFVQTWAGANHDVLVFFREDYVYLSCSFRDHLERGYVRLPDYSPLSVYKPLAPSR